MIEDATQGARGKDIAQADGPNSYAAVNHIHLHNPSPNDLATFLPTRSARAVHLDPPPALFIGREPELAALHQHLAREGGVVYIPGFPGRGKSTLANQYAHLHQDEYQTVHWLPCHAKSLVEIAAEFAWQLELKLDGDLQANLKQLRAHCARNRCLLILDNVDDEAPAGMLLGGRSSVLLTTWHTNLKFLRPVPAVPLPVFTEEQCLELFREKIGAHEVDRHRAESRLLFERLERHPFALDIAASLIREDRRYTIASMAKNLPADIPALFAEAIATLSPDAQSLLAAMAACAPEGFRLSLAAEVAGFDENTAFSALYKIRARSLIDDLESGAQRYRLHALVREAAAADTTLRQRHANLIHNEFAHWETDWHNCINDIADWQQALTWSLCQISSENWTQGDALAFYGFSLTLRVGRLPEAYGIAERMARVATIHKDNDSVQQWYSDQAIILQAWGRLDEAMMLLKEQESICEETANKFGLMQCYTNQANILHLRGEYDAAMRLQNEGEALCEELDNRRSLQNLIGNQAVSLIGKSRFDEAMVLLQKQQAICEEIDEKAGLRRSYGNQAIIYRIRGKLYEALEIHNKVEVLCKEMNDQEGLAYCYWNWGLLARDQEDAAVEKEKLAQSLSLFQTLGMPRELAAVQNQLTWANGNHLYINRLRLWLSRILGKIVTV